MGQGGTLKGLVKDRATNEPIPFANVVVFKDGQQVGGAITNFDGEFTIKPIPAGKYTVKSTFVGYGAVEIPGVIINSDKITFLTKSQTIMLSEGIVKDVVEIVHYRVPLIDPDKRGATVTREQISKLPIRSAVGVAATTGGVASQDGEVGSIRGSRDGADVYIDGVRVVGGSSSLPQQAIEQVTTITGGVPAQFGDNTGGIINITTRGPSGRAFGGIEVLSSQFTDAYGYNDANFSYSTPLWKKRDTSGTEYSVAGVFLSGQVISRAVARPSSLGVWKVKDDVLAELEADPF